MQFKQPVFQQRVISVALQSRETSGLVGNVNERCFLIETCRILMNDSRKCIAISESVNNILATVCLLRYKRESKNHSF
jgi:hypothetical protein